MSTTTPPNPSTSRLPPKAREVAPMQVSRYDQVASVLVSVLVLLGFIVGLMLLVWLSTRFTFQQVVVPVTLVEELGGGGKGNGQPNAEQEFDDVPPEELADLQEPNVEQQLQTLTDAISTQDLNVETVEANVSGLGNGEGPGMGDGRGPGPGGPGTATQLPEWEVRFAATTLDLYARQLDFFGIELGAIGGGKKTVDYASKLASPAPLVRSGAGSAEKRRYLLWRKGPLAAADKQLLTKAGIDSNGRIVMQFLPEPVEKQMALLEAQHAKGRKLSEIRRTVYGVKPAGMGYEFFVLEQEYRGGA